MTLSLINLDPVDSNGDAGDSDAERSEGSEVEYEDEGEDEEEEEEEDDRIQNIHGDGIDESDS